MPDDRVLRAVMRYYVLPDGTMDEEILVVTEGPDRHNWYRLALQEDPKTTIAVMRDYAAPTEEDRKAAKAAKIERRMRKYEKITAWAEASARAKLAAMLREQENGKDE